MDINAFRFWCSSRISARSSTIFGQCIPTIGDIIYRMELQHHQYANDTQRYIAIRAAQSMVDLTIIDESTIAVHEWFLRNDLLLNPWTSHVIDPDSRSASYPFKHCIHKCFRRSNTICEDHTVTWIEQEGWPLLQQASQYKWKSISYRIRALQQTRQCIPAD